ncbi:MAG: MMPL family transporter [Gordonia paraffinivorans]
MAHGRSARFARFGAGMARRRWWVVVFWVLLVVGLNLAVPQLESTVAQRSAPFLPTDMPSQDALRAMSRDFGSPASTALGSIVAADDRGLDAADERWYRTLVDRLTADHENVAYVLDMDGNPATRSAARSPDGKAVHLTVAAEGDVGSTRAHHSTVAIRALVDDIPRPDGLRVHYTGPSPTLADLFSSIDLSLLIITGVSVLLITVLLVIAYRSLITALVPLITIGVALGVARPIVSLLGLHDVVGVSNFSIAIMTALVLGAGTDYAIFLIAGHHDARRRGRSPDDAVSEATARTSAIVVASAATIAAAAGAMAFTQVGMFRTSGPPTAVGVLVTMAVCLTLTPALMSVAARRGHLEPRASTERRWRRVGTAVVRRSGALTVVAMVVLVALAAVIPTFRVSYDESSVQIYGSDSTRGYDLVREHWGVNEVVPEYLLVRSDHDMRDTTDLAALELMAMSVSKAPGIAYVRSITRPDGRPLAESATGFSTGTVGGQLTDAHRRVEAATPELQRLANGVTALRDGADEAAREMPRLVAGTDEVVSLADGVLSAVGTAERIVAIASDGTMTLPSSVRTLAALADTVSALLTEIDDDARRSAAAADGLRSVFGPMLAGADGPDCARDPACAAARAAFLAVDRATGGRAGQALREATSAASVPSAAVARAHALLPELRTGLSQLQTLLDRLDGRSPAELRAQLGDLTDGVSRLSTGLDSLADGLRQAKAGTDQTVTLTAELTAGLQRAGDYLTTMSDATRSGAGAGFYLPPQALSDPRFVAGTRLLMSPDGRSARMLVIRSTNPYGHRALSEVGTIVDAARAGARGTVLEHAAVSSTGLTSLSADMNRQVQRDFALYAAVAVLAVLAILILLLRSLLAPVLLVAAVLLSFAATVGLSILFWQHLLGIDLDWSVIPVSFMALVAVGADYSMLFASRIREHSRHGMIGGVIRGFGTTGGVITTAGVVFAVTMVALMSATVTNLLQIGFTVGVGLILDVAVVRTVLVPAAMAAIGNRIWWPARA